MTDRFKSQGQAEHSENRDRPALGLGQSRFSEERKFGLVMAGAVIAVAAVRYIVHWLHAGARPAIPVYFLVVAAAFVLLALIWPRALKPLLIVWMRIALTMNWAVNHVVMTLAFFVLIVPMRAIMMVVGKDPLNRKWAPKAASYWEPPDEQPDEFARYKNQF